MIIRKANLKDIEWISSKYEQLICTLTNVVYQHQEDGKIVIENIIQNELLGGLFIAENEEKQCMGFISLSFQYAVRTYGYYAIIQEFFVEEKYRSKGVGEQFILKVKEYLYSKNISTIEVGLPRFQYKSIEILNQFYTRHGFEIIGNRMRFEFQ